MKSQNVGRTLRSNKTQTRLSLENDTDDINEIHGRKFVEKYSSGKWKAPARAVTCHSDARPGYDTKKAHEYLDCPKTLKEKVKALALMLQNARNCVLYTGAGISTASGINDYATKAGSKSISKSKFKPRSAFDALPTLAHHTLTALQTAGLVTYWVQQNHDGLPQKAGFPQHLLNEIHGAWFDPSNPVIPMSGDLRGDLFDDLMEWEEKADMVLAMGTSMCGMNADRVVTTCAQKGAFGLTTGAVIINLQRTQHDNLASLRIYAKIDDVMKLLADEFSLWESPSLRRFAKQEIYTLPASLRTKATKSGQVFKLPYHPITGKYLGMMKKTKSTNIKNDIVEEEIHDDKFSQAECKVLPKESLTLDLRPGKTVKLTAGMYKDDIGEVIGVNSRGDYVIRFLHKNKKSKKGKLLRKGIYFQRRLGSWWIEAATKGQIPLLPIVNITSKSSQK